MFKRFVRINQKKDLNCSNNGDWIIRKQYVVLKTKTRKKSFSKTTKTTFYIENNNKEISKSESETKLHFLK